MTRNFWLQVRSAMLLPGLLLTLPVQAAFTVNGGGTVTDTATGLMWDQCSWGQSGAACASGTLSLLNWQQALGVAVTANNSSYKGHTDWRLPNSNELESLVDLFHTNPAINTTAFPNTAGVNSAYWTSTSGSFSSSAAWQVSFDQGSTLIKLLSAPGYVRLVRGGPSFSPFDAQAPTPGWPYNIVAIAGDTLAAVSFGSADGNGSVFDGYTVVSTPVGAVDSAAGKNTLNHIVTGLRNGTSYTFMVQAHNLAGDDAWSVASNPVVPAPMDAIPSIGNFVFSPETMLIGVDGTGSTSAVSAFASSGLVVSFSSSTEAVCSIRGNLVTALTTGTCAIAADQAGDASHPAASQVIQSINVSSLLPPGPLLNVGPAWNLMGNSVAAPLQVASAFADVGHVNSVWKWIPGTSRWAFYAPAFTANDLGTYAAAKGYDVLNTIDGGEGFWVSAKAAFTVQMPSGPVVSVARMRDQLDPAQNMLQSGWNLRAVGDNVTPSAFNQALSSTPPAPDVMALNFISLWAWDNALGNWLFYAPSLEADGSMSSYTSSKGYLDFGLKTIGPTDGFWLRK